MSNKLIIDNFPPYGFTSVLFSRGTSRLPPPLAGHAGLYAAWVRTLAEELSDHIWPRYDRATARWVGQARDQAVALTECDFEILEELASYFTANVNHRQVAGAKPLLHSELFLEEDQFVLDPALFAQYADPNNEKRERPYKKWAASFFCYDKEIPVTLCERLSHDFDGEGSDESGTLSMDLKELMQRPRPSQTAMLFGRPAFRYQYAHSACTPSLVSGHAIQSAISGCYVFRKYRKDLDAIAGAVDSWAQMTVDVGDRRVFAGVHYPSDSISSWVCALRAIKEFYGEEGVAARDFLWHAISTKSTVYRHVAAHVVRRPDSPYAPILGWLAAVAKA